VKLPVDERLGGCRGFKSHRPHQSSIVGSARLSTMFFVFSLPLILILILVPNELRDVLKSEKSDATSTAASMAYPKNLLNIALVLSALTAVLHLYIGLQVYEIPLGVPLILIAFVYIGGIALIAANNRRALWLKIGIYWVIIVIVLWAASAAVDAPNTNIPLAYIDKAVEFILLGILLRIRTTR